MIVGQTKVLVSSNLAELSANNHFNNSNCGNWGGFLVKGLAQIFMLEGWLSVPKSHHWKVVET